MISKYIDLKRNIEYSKLKAPADVIQGGGLVLFPTETVYGIGANALDAKACAKIYKAKKREQDNPLIVHICNTEMLLDVTAEVR